MLTIEKVAILRGVPIFASIPDFILASIAQVTGKVDIANGVTFIQEGAVEDCLYIIVEGQVRVHSKERQIINLQAG